MNNEYKQDASGWYAPMARPEEQKSAAPAPVERRRGLPAVWRVLLGLLLVMGLIVGTSLFFGGRNPASRRERDTISLPGFDSGFNFVLPEIPDVFSDKDEDEDEPMPEDWKEYFDSYFVMDDRESEAPRIPLVEQRPEWELVLVPYSGKERSLQEIYRDCVDSIVSIQGYVDGEMGYYWGTGIVLSEDGLILTNAHMIEGCDSATVTLQNNELYEAKLVGTDSISDIAVLKIEAEKLRPAVFGDSELLTVGEDVAALGNPLGEEFRATLTDGIVSAIDRGMRYSGRSMNLIQTNTAINEGNSGGALLNMYGQVIGVTNMKMMSYMSSIEGIGFAIPSATVRGIVNALIRDGEVKGRPALGITVGPVSEMAAGHYELPEGLYVSAVSEGSDAQRKGVAAGDIITHVNGEPAKSSDDILTVRDTLSIGDTMNFTIWRDGETFDVDVELMETNDIY